MNVTPPDSVILSQHHRQWLNDPITKTGQKRIIQYEEEVVMKIAAASMSMNLSTEYVRLLASQLSTIKALRTLLYDTETFVEKHGNR